jgi:predicted nucleic-acid-binding protein
LHYRRRDNELNALLQADNVVFDRSAAEAGRAFLLAGGNFADGLVAHEGRRLGGEVFVTFDRKAAKIATSQGVKAQRAT